MENYQQKLKPVYPKMGKILTRRRYGPNDVVTKVRNPKKVVVVSVSSPAYRKYEEENTKEETLINDELNIPRTVVVENNPKYNKTLFFHTNRYRKPLLTRINLKTKKEFGMDNDDKDRLGKHLKVNLNILNSNILSSN